MKRAVVFSPIWGLGCIFLILSSSCRHSDISGDGLSDAVYLSAEVLQGPLGKGAPVAGAHLTQWAVFGYRQGDRLWSDQLEGTVLPSLFYDVPVDKQSDGSWSYGTPVAWGGLIYDYYAFFGYAPKATGVYRDPENPMGNNLEVVGTSSTAGVAQLHYETLADVTNQIDLLAGMRTNLPASEKVTMHLGHTLSQIRFAAWSAQAGVTPVSIAINGVHYKGVLSSKGGKAAWLSTDPEVRGFDLRGNYPVLSLKEDQPTDLSADGRSFMLLPQDLTANATATIGIVALVGGVEVISTPYVINENWEAGKSYTYVLKLGGSPTEELIVTDVLVTDWVVDSEEDMETNPVLPPAYIDIDGLRWATGSLVANGSNGCKIGAPTDYGVYFQFGSLVGWTGGATGNGVGATNTSLATAVQVKPATYGGTDAWTTVGRYIDEGTAGTDYGLPSSDNASTGIGDPCRYYLGAPWRTPTAAEYLTLLGADGANTNKDMPLKVNNYDLSFPASGYCNTSHGSFEGVGSSGLNWSSSVTSATNGYSLYFNGGTIGPQYTYIRSFGFPVRCVSEVPAPPSNPVNPPTASDYVEIDGLKWTKGNLVASSSTANNINGCKVGAPTDGGLYFQFGSLIGWKGGATANNGTGVGSNPNTGSGTEYWGGAGSWSWSNEAMVWPAAMSGTPSSWPQPTSGTEHQWYFSGQGATSGEINVNDPTKGVGDPCTYYLGDPWRLPTAAEYLAVFDNAANGTAWSSVANWSWTTTPYNGAQRTGNNLFFPASGYRDGSSGAFDGVTSNDFCWSSSVGSATYGYYLYFNNSSVYPQNNNGRSNGFPVRCVSGTYVAPNPVNPPTASDYVEIGGVKWAKGNLVASSSTASGSNGCKVGAPTDGGLYFQFGSLIGYKGGATANNGTGVGSNPYTGSNQYWGGAGSWSWSNDAMVWPARMAGTPSSWPQPTSGTAHQWYFSGQGATSGEINVNDPTKGVGDPCTYYLGDPWRLPTAAEYKTLFDDARDATNWGSVLNWGWVTSPYNGAQHTGNPLFFPAAGNKDYLLGAFYAVTKSGFFWSSSVSDAMYGFQLTVDESRVYPQMNSERSYGFSVRCVAK